VSYRHISFGDDCGPFSRIERSLFERSPKKIAAALFRRTGIDLGRFDFGLDSTSDPDSEAWQELYKIPEFCAKPLIATLSRLDHYEAPLHPRSLSSNEIFNKIIVSPWARHLLSAHDSMGRAIDDELEQLDRELKSMFHRLLTVREVELRVHAITAHLGIDRPGGRTRICLLQWLSDNWTESKTFMLREFFVHTEWGREMIQINKKF
jgi:hypothetical protein